MKLFYPYFNLFCRAGTDYYRLDVVVKIPGSCEKSEIVQNFVGDYWEVRIKLKENKALDAFKEKIEEYRIDLKPKDVKQLDKIKIVVKNYDNKLRNGDPDGEGLTGKGNGELE
jgi:hypothetical protein